MKKQIIETGLDVLVADGFKGLKNQRVAVLANQASVNKDLQHIVSLAIKHGVKVVKLFAPEHGFTGTLQDMEHVGGSKDHRLNIPVISLYGDHKESLILKAEHLSDVDILLCDLQDVGSRYYTFHCTIAWAMAACLKTKTHLMVIDRPNPIGAQIIEGNLVKAPHFSFVGAYPLPNRHGFTMGELVGYVRDALKVNFQFDVIWMKSYNRASYFDELNLAFVPPSPNMPTVNTAIVYPGMCLIEGTNLSEGRGTCTPFEVVGAPYIKDPEEFKGRFDAYKFPGVVARPCYFKPKFQKHQDQNCGGLFLHVTDRHSFSPLRVAFGIIALAMKIPGFDWRREPYEFETDRLAIDLLLGDLRLRQMLEQEKPLDDIFPILAEEEEAFNKLRKEYLHY
jgi:uncharacterized protein YbbC (DUF1343 family)